MMFEPVAVMVVVIVVAASNQEVGLAAGAVYALAYTLELGLSLSPLPGIRDTMTRVALDHSRAGLALTLPASALASTVEGDEEEKFDPSHEWLLHDWIPIHLGPLDLSINKAVAYLMLGSVLTILWAGC